jgi:hypothetical protein
MDPDSPGFCGDPDGGLRVLLELQPQACGAPGNEYVRLCSYGFAADTGIIMLGDECTRRAEIYKLDMKALDALATPQVITSIYGLEALNGFVEHLGGFDDVHCHDGGMEARAAVFEDDVAIIVTSNECSRCAAEWPCDILPDPCDDSWFVEPTPFLWESCETPPCCGNRPCRCDGFAGNYCVMSQKYARVLLHTAAGDTFQLDGRFLEEEGGTESLSILGDWVTWQADVKGQQDIFLFNRSTGERRRLTFAPTGQEGPVLTEFAGQVQLVWMDNRLGDMKLFHTPLR